MTQLPLDYTGPTREERVDVWLWCAYLMRTEVTPLEYIYPRPQGEEAERINAELDALLVAGDAFAEKAAKVNGAPVSDERWQAAMERFTTIK